MNTHKLTAPYFVLQSLTVLLWWLTLWLHPPSRLYFLPPRGADVFLLAFVPPDMVRIVVGGFFARTLCSGACASAGSALCVAVMALSYATPYWLAPSFLPTSAWASVSMMSADTLISAGLAIGYTSPP